MPPPLPVVRKEENTKGKLNVANPDHNKSIDRSIYLNYLGFTSFIFFLQLVSGPES